MDAAITLAQAVALTIAAVLGVLFIVKKSMRTKWVGGVLCVWVAYTLLYIVLSLNGRYEPFIIGLSGVKSYEWAPRGFVRDYKWRLSMRRTFAVYHMLDSQLWHRYGPLYSLGNRPVNEVQPEDIGEVYQAWGY